MDAKKFGAFIAANRSHAKRKKHDTNGLGKKTASNRQGC